MSKPKSNPFENQSKTPADSSLSSTASSNQQVSSQSFDEKAEQEKKYRHQLLEDLLSQRTVYSGGPYEAHIQFSNYCNMSCIMCWDGRNPPAEKSSPELLNIISQQVAPHLSVITPYSGSEPLVWSWDETREMAMQNSVLLCITTNCQYLDEQRFHELKDITETLLLSIDSHIPEIFEIIRPGGNTQKVYANLKTTARLCREYQVECIVNIVLMTLNAPHLAETIEYLGDLGIESVNVIQMLDVNGRSSYFDPLLHFSQEYIDWVKQRCLKMTQKKQMRLIWSVAGFFEYDYRPSDCVQPLDRKSWNDRFDARMRRMFPGFCRNVFNRLRIDRHGDVAPCCYATQGQLSLGNLNTQHFDDIWNGPSAQDLRRGMLCGDVPAHCSSCRFIDPIGPQKSLEFVEIIDEEIRDSATNGQEISAQLILLEPTHASRHEDPPEIQFARPNYEIREYQFVISFAGETEDIHRITIDSVDTADQENVFRFQIPDAMWQQLRSNVGYWWNLWAIPADANHPILRFEHSSALIRHRHLPRIEGSDLQYIEDGALPIIDLGVSKQIGWETPEITPSRPDILDRMPVHNVEIPKDFDVEDYGRPNLYPSREPDSIGQRMAKWIGLNKKTKFRPFTRKGNVMVLDGYLDQVVEHPDYIHIIGWVLLKTGAADSVEFLSSNQHSVKSRQVRRPDLEFGFPNIDSACEAGFEVKLKLDQFKTDLGYEFELITRVKDEVISRVHVTRFKNPDNNQKLGGGPYWFGNSERITIT